MWQQFLSSLSYFFSTDSASFQHLFGRRLRFKRCFDSKSETFLTWSFTAQIKWWFVFFYASWTQWMRNKCEKKDNSTGYGILFRIHFIFCDLNHRFVTDFRSTNFHKNRISLSKLYIEKCCLGHWILGIARPGQLWGPAQ